VRHADETRWRVIEDVENKQQQAWLSRNKHHAYFTIEGTRGGDIPLRVMNGAAGALVADDYAGYNKLVDENEHLRVQCWSHTRRKFFEIQNLYPEIQAYLDLIKELYKKDTEFRAEGEQTSARRRDLCGPVIEAIDTWRKVQQYLPKSPMGKALHYMNDNWDGLTAFLDDPELPLDNNPAERALRQLVLGRKNFLFNRSMRGAKVAAILYSICVSYALSGADPKLNMKETILRLRNCRDFQLPYDFVNQHEAIRLL
jgi:transposase